MPFPCNKKNILICFWGTLQTFSKLKTYFKYLFVKKTENWTSQWRKNEPSAAILDLHNRGAIETGGITD